MSKILITGNGFDLFHHLPTKYGHFMAIMRTIESFDFPEQLTFEDLFGRVFKSEYSSDYDSILKNYDTEKIFFDKQKIANIEGMIKTNSWYNHFKSVTEIETWIDFETEIGKVLSDFSTIFEQIRQDPDRYNSIDKHSIKIYRDYSNFECFIDSDNIYVRINNKYLNSKSRKIKEKEILMELAKSLESFIIIFNRYLTDVVYKFYDNSNCNCKVPMDCLDEIYTVNYTPTIERIYNNNLSKITYLHGKSNESNRIQNLVLGVSEIPEIIKESKIYDFTKYYQRIKEKTNHRFIDIPKEKTNNIRVEKMFYIIGHSLDESDKTYIYDLFKFLEYDLKKNSKVCIFYYNSSDRESKLRNLFSILDKDILIEMDKEKRLYFVELTEENIIKEFNKKLRNLPPDIYI